MKSRLASSASLVSSVAPRATSLMEHVIFTASSYIEVLGFVPAVWRQGSEVCLLRGASRMVHQSAKKNDDVTRTGGVDLTRQAAT